MEMYKLNPIFTLFYISLTDGVYRNEGIIAFSTTHDVQNAYKDQKLFEVIFDSDLFRYPISIREYKSIRGSK